MAKRKLECRAFTNDQGEHQFFDCKDWTEISALNWVVIDRGKSYVETPDAKRYSVRHYVTGQSREQFDSARQRPA